MPSNTSQQHQPNKIFKRELLITPTKKIVMLIIKINRKQANNKKFLNALCTGVIETLCHVLGQNTRFSKCCPLFKIAVIVGQGSKLTISGPLTL